MKVNLFFYFLSDTFGQDTKVIYMLSRYSINLKPNIKI